MGKVLSCFSSLLGLVLPLLFATPVCGDIVVGGNRPVTVHVPPTYDPDVPMPLVFLLHGFTGTAAGMETYWQLTPLADQRGFLYAFPQGTRDSQGRTFWDATDACCNFDPEPVDDSGYLRGLIEEIADQLNVDRDRIYFAGLSNGGFMSHRMACDYADVVAAIASQAGATFSDAGRCTPAAPVHILQIHGTNDQVIRYGGGATGSGPYPGAMATVRHWATHNGCSLEAETVAGSFDIDANIAGAETTRIRFANECATGGCAELWTIPGGVHVPMLVRNGATTNLGMHVVDWLFAHAKRAAPVASFSITPANGAAPLKVVLDASESTAPEGASIATYSWDFGEGTLAKGPTIERTYGPGLHSVSLAVITDDGRVSLRTTRTVTVSCPQSDVAPWAASTVGEPSFPSTARFEDADPDSDASHDLVVCSGGRSIGGRSDELLFVEQEVSGNFRITARVAEISAQRFAAVGVMFRTSLAAEAPFAAMLLETTANAFRFRYRSSPAGSARSEGGQDFESAGYVRIERRGNLFIGSSSLDGETWSPLAAQPIDGMPETMLVGFAVASLGVSGDVFEPVHARITPLEAIPVAFVRGDCNNDGTVDISDAVCILNWLFGVGATPGCFAVTNTNGDAGTDISDAIGLLNFLFSGGPAPVAPFPECGSGTLSGNTEHCETVPQNCQE